MTFRVNGEGISSRQQSVKGEIRKLTANDGKTIKILQSLTVDQASDK